jgi:hypothetical protein
MNGLENLAISAYRFHIGECQRLKERVNALCAIVNAHPNRDDIYCSMPIVEGEVSGNITIEGYRTLEAYFTEALEIHKMEAVA